MERDPISGLSFRTSARRFNRQRNLTTLAVLHGIGSKVAKDLAYAVRIGFTVKENRRVDVQRQPCFIRSGLNVLGNFTEDGCHVRTRELERDLPRFRARQLEQLINEI